MAREDRYQVDRARDDPLNLHEVLQDIATREGHVRIVNVIWTPARDDERGLTLLPGYTIVSEINV